MIHYHRPTVHCLLAICVASCMAGLLEAADSGSSSEYLSDMLADQITSQQGWGRLGVNSAAKPTNGPAAQLRIKDKTYQHGLGHHANGEILVALGGQYQTFKCEIGVQQNEQNRGSVIFQIYADDKKVFDSGIIRASDPPREVAIPVAGDNWLRLVANDAGDGINSDCANWAEARLLPNHAVNTQPDQPPVDIAKFAQVVTSDPNRMQGTAAERAQEFPQEDVFFETEVPPAADGSYLVPVAENNMACIGLRWPEGRLLRRLELHWADATTQPPAENVQLQYWVGESPWQGEWKPLPAKLTQSQGMWQWQITCNNQPAATVRVRWLFSATKKPSILKAIAAFSRSSWTTADLRFELPHPTAGEQAQVVVYNGSLLGANEQAFARTCMWDVSQPLTLRVRYSKPTAIKADRTVLRFELPKRAISVAVEDIVAHGCVYVPTAGLFASGNPPQRTLSEYLQNIADKKTVLEQVREQPDQSLAEAMAKTHNPIQNLGPMLLSLACDNRKFVAEREGMIRFDLYDAPDGNYPSLTAYWLNRWKAKKPHVQMTPQFGGGHGKLNRHLDGGWLPKPVTTVVEDGITYQQCTYVAPVDEKAPDGSPGWYRQRALCVVEYTIENTLSTEAAVSLKITLAKSDGKTKMPDRLQEVEDGLAALDAERVLAYFDADQLAPLNLARQDDRVVVAGKLPGGKSARLVVYLPAWPIKPDAYADLRGADKWAERTEQYWNNLLAGAMRIDIPDRLLANVIRASQVHCFLAARNANRGAYVSPWIASLLYGPFESEAQAIIRGMDMCGQTEFARRGLEFFLQRYNTQGFLTTGYTMVGTGEHLWTLAEFQSRHGDQAWLEKAAPTLVRACKWIIAQRAKTKRLDARGNKVPEYGLMPPGVSADWNRFAYRFFNEAQFCHGLETAAQALADIGHPDAPVLLADAKAYRKDLLRAYHWSQTRCPVVALGNGVWTPNHPAMLTVFGNVEEFMPMEDWSCGPRTWLYGVELGAHHLAANHILDPRSDQVAQMLDYLEDYQFLRSGLRDYTEEKNRQDIFNLGGFAKAQPFYARNAELYALRDDVKPYIRSYFNAVSSLLSAENLSLREHFNGTSAWNKTHETGWFLAQTAIMFAMDRDSELWLAPMATNRWLQDGKKIVVRNAPTRFGAVSYTITSAAASGHIDATIEPPTRKPFKQLVIRIRHPEGKPMRAVTVNGKPHLAFDPLRECIMIPPTTTSLTMRVKY